MLGRCNPVALLAVASNVPSLLQNPPDWHEILTYFRGSELQNYFTKILEDDLKVGGARHQVTLSSTVAPNQ
jgi:translation initiation factor RLI1